MALLFFLFLAHLSRRLRMSYCDHLSSVIVSRPSTLLNDFSSEIPWPFVFKLHMEPAVKGGLKFCSNCYGPLIIMTVMPTHGKSIKSFLQNQENFEAESCNIATRIQGLSNLFK